ncbi:MAG: hypothetical protein HY731_14785 [Candidatus Tectomicrobia bacterium]|nr:hypothetical protein [Candidatus Tectomicrobia bacterium]
MRKGLVLLLTFMLTLGSIIKSTHSSSETLISEVKNITENEETNISKEINITVNQDTLGESSAESEVVVIDESNGNRLTENDNVDSSAVIENRSFEGVNGIIGINQSPGSLNNQGNSVSVSFVKEGTDSFLNSNASVSSSASDNQVTAIDAERSNIIESSAFEAATGIISINQSAGNINVQHNIVSLSIGGSPVSAISNIELERINGSQLANNVVLEQNVSKIDRIERFAFQGASGIISINQSSGNMNNQMNIVTISYNKFPFP